MGNEEASGFNEGADSAARALKAKLGVEPKQVEVGPDGRQPVQPPEGSYIAMADQARRQQMQQAQQRQDVVGDQPPAGTMDQALDGSQAPVIPDGGTQQSEGEGSEISPNVQRRFSELTQRLRALEQEKQQHEAQAKAMSETNAELAAKLQAIQKAHDDMVQANLDNLDPETRMQVLQDARMNEMFAGMERRIMDSIMPHLQGLQQQTAQTEMMRLAEKYPAFDIQIHGPLIDMFRGKNPNCSVEQAYRAIAESDDELVTRNQVTPTNGAPPIVAPGQRNGSPRYIPQPEPDPEQEMIEDAQRIAKLRGSSDPSEQREGIRLIEKNIAQRLANQFGW